MGVSDFRSRRFFLSFAPYKDTRKSENVGRVELVCGCVSVCLPVCLFVCACVEIAVGSKRDKEVSPTRSFN